MNRSRPSLQTFKLCGSQAPTPQQGARARSGGGPEEPGRLPLLPAGRGLNAANRLPPPLRPPSPPLPHARSAAARIPPSTASQHACPSPAPAGHVRQQARAAGCGCGCGSECGCGARVLACAPPARIAELQREQAAHEDAQLHRLLSRRSWRRPSRGQLSADDGVSGGGKRVAAERRGDGEDGMAGSLASARVVSVCGCSRAGCECNRRTGSASAAAAVLPWRPTYVFRSERAARCTAGGGAVELSRELLLASPELGVRGVKIDAAAGEVQVLVAAPSDAARRSVQLVLEQVRGWKQG
eukprot:191497-Chlamydomonas_euryale.AAC.1